MENKSTLKKIIPAPLFRRTLGALADFVMTVFVGLGLFIGLSAMFSSFPNIKAYKDEAYSIFEQSGIVVINDDKLDLIKKETYKGYEEMFFTFYQDFMPTMVEYDVVHDTYWYNVHIYGQDDALNLYSSAEIEKMQSPLAKHYGKSLFTYLLDENEQPIYDQFALPIAMHNDPDAEMSASEKTKVMNYYYVSDEALKDDAIAKMYRYIYFYALSDLTSIPLIVTNNVRYTFFASTLPFAIGIVFTMFIFYFIIPLCFKNGESLGKLMTHTCLVNKIGYRYKRSQLILRFLFPAFLVALILLFGGVNMTTFIILSFIILVSYLMVLFTKDNRAIHDYLAGTIVIDKVASTFFKDASEEKRYEEETEKFVSLIENKEDIRNDENTLYVNPHYHDNDENQSK